MRFGYEGEGQQEIQECYKHHSEAGDLFRAKVTTRQSLGVVAVTVISKYYYKKILHLTRSTS